jgi:signal peptidase
MIDQQAGQMLGMAKESYLQENKDKFSQIDEGMYLDLNSGLIIYSVPPTDVRYLGLNNGTYAGEGISYLAPVKSDWVIGVARAKIPLVGYVRLLPNIIGEEIHKLIS